MSRLEWRTIISLQKARWESDSIYDSVEQRSNNGKRQSIMVLMMDAQTAGAVY